MSLIIDDDIRQLSKKRKTKTVEKFQILMSLMINDD